MQVSLSTGSLYIYPLRKTFELARRAGFDGVEIVIGPEVELRGPEYVRRLSLEYKLPVLSVHPPLFGFPGWSSINESYAPYLARAVSLTCALGAPLMVVHMPRAKSYEEELGRAFIERVVQTRHQHNGHGPALAIENSSKMREIDHTYILRELPELRSFADQHDFAMTLDTAHVGTWDLDLLSSLQYFDGRVRNVHLSDLSPVPEWVQRSPRLHSFLKQHQLPGAGLLPLTALLRELKVRGYHGPITFELSPVALEFWSPRRVAQRLRESVEFVHNALA